MMAAEAHIQRGHRLPSYALFAGLLAAAGLPIYIHAPKFFVDTYGVSLASLGAVLFALRLLDVVQDPLLGRLARAVQNYRALSAGIALAILASAMVGLFAVTPPVAPLIWFAAMLTLLFSAYSYLTIIFYAQGVAKAPTLGQGGHLQVARWRETGALLGVCLASVAPVAAAALSAHPFAVFAAAFAGVALMAALAMQTEWSATSTSTPSGFGIVLRDPPARRLLLIALVNAAPVAVSSTLFLFFVESRLAAPGAEGPLLLLFFLSAAVAAPLWGRLADRLGARSVLLVGMVLSILAFGGALFLGTGDITWFALICLASGAALGADMTLLPAMFSQRMARIAPEASEAFGLWSFVTKFALAFAAVTLLPLLEAAGFQSGTDNSPQALTRLTLLYAAVPCALKLVAIALLATFKTEDSTWQN
ncbi:MAG: MFS transporter [Paracoccaceae bacterium]